MMRLLPHCGQPAVERCAVERCGVKNVASRCCWSWRSCSLNSASCSSEWVGWCPWARSSSLVMVGVVLAVSWAILRMASTWGCACSAVASRTKGAGEPFKGAAVVTGLLPQSFPYSFWGALAPLGRGPEELPRSLILGDTLSPLGATQCRASLDWGWFTDENFPHGRHVPARSGRCVDEFAADECGAVPLNGAG